MFDDVLARAAFVKLYKEKGAGDEALIEEEWKKVEQCFSAYFVENAFAALSDEEKKQIGGGYDPKNPEDVRSFVDKLISYLGENKEKLPVQQIVENSVKQAYNKAMGGQI